MGTEAVATQQQARMPTHTLRRQSHFMVHDYGETGHSSRVFQLCRGERDLYSVWGDARGSVDDQTWISTPISHPLSLRWQITKYVEENVVILHTILSKIMSVFIWNAWYCRLPCGCVWTSLFWAALYSEYWYCIQYWTYTQFIFFGQLKVCLNRPMSSFQGFSDYVHKDLRLYTIFPPST